MCASASFQLSGFATMNSPTGGKQNVYEWVLISSAGDKPSGCYQAWIGSKSLHEIPVYTPYLSAQVIGMVYILYVVKILIKIFTFIALYIQLHFLEHMQRPGACFMKLAV